MPTVLSKTNAISAGGLAKCPVLRKGIAGRGRGEKRTLEMRDTGVDGVAVWLGVEAVAVCVEARGGPRLALEAAVRDEDSVAGVSGCEAVDGAEGGRRRRTCCRGVECQGRGFANVCGEVSCCKLDGEGGGEGGAGGDCAGFECCDELVGGV